MCACTEPVRTGIGAVLVEYGRSKWPITMLNHTHKHPCYRIMFFFFFGTLCSYDPLWRSFFFPGKTKEKKARVARAPHYYRVWNFVVTTRWWIQLTTVRVHTYNISPSAIKVAAVHKYNWVIRAKRVSNCYIQNKIVRVCVCACVRLILVLVGGRRVFD